jgi:flavin reductase (DIM6/NTAB) family NADH-FMN oxidoreductase RutF
MSMVDGSNQICKANLSIPEHVQALSLPHACRLLNTGATVLVSSAHSGKSNIMAAAWNMPVDFDPPKLAVIVDKTTFTRTLIEASGEFALCIPPLGLADLAFTVGSCSGRDLEAEDKFERFGIETFEASCISAPLVRGCVGWLECKLITERRTQDTYDLIIGEVVAAWADSRAFADGRYRPVDEIPPALRTIHHLGSGQFVVPGQQVQARAQPL